MFVYCNVYHSSVGTLYTSRHKRKLGCDLARVNMVACLPCLTLYCELAAYQLRLALIYKFLVSGSGLSTLGTARLHRGFSKQRTSRFDDISQIFYKLSRAATCWVIRLSKSECLDVAIQGTTSDYYLIKVNSYVYQNKFTSLWTETIGIWSHLLTA